MKCKQRSRSHVSGYFWKQPFFLLFLKKSASTVAFSNHFYLSTRTCIWIFLKTGDFSLFSKKSASTHSIFKLFLPVHDIWRHRFRKPPLSSVHTAPKSFEVLSLDFEKVITAYFVVENLIIILYQYRALKRFQTILLKSRIHLRIQESI